jgi:MFS family permease
MYMIVYVPSTFLLSDQILGKMGTLHALLVGGILMLLGIWIRVAINYNVYFLIIGSVFCGFAQPLLMNAPAKLSANWFGTSERSIATSIGAVASPCGTAIGFLIPLTFVSETSGREDVFKASLLLALVFTGTILFALIFFKEKPPTPPRYD